MSSAVSLKVPRAHGSPLSPSLDMAGKEEGAPTHPRLHGRYVTVDLGENNRHMNDGTTDFGWGVCRQGLGLQDLPRMDEAKTTAKAKEPNERTPVGPAGIGGAV
ncbi:MAG: hypothetical protein JSS68_09335 [Actinobacteria bacterium]|nr:hypothetical protein [Actinomycetota bacterium]MBS1882930.1 hypothetical protein [Actinomycetota bacterium]